MTRDTIRCRERDLEQWSNGQSRTRFDHSSKDYTLKDMLNEDYFGACWALLRPGDYVWITDCEDQTVVVRIDMVDKASMKVAMSTIEKLHAHPIVDNRSDDPNDPGLVYRYRSVRGGGHCIVTEHGEVVAIEFPTREHAEQAIAVMYETRHFSPPPNHDPEGRIKSAKIFKPR